MKILHTSDWHIGRSFHGHSTVESLRGALDALVQVVRDRGVDVVAVAGDIFDSATPAAEYYELLTEVLRDLRAAGAVVVMTSGNHDSATRLGFQSEFAQLAGIHVITRHSQHDQPVVLHDEHGPVHFYGIPYLEPALIRHHYPEATLKTHEQVLRFAMDRIRADLAARGGRSVVLSHCFAIGIGSDDAKRSKAGDGDVPAGDVRAGDAGTRDVLAGDGGASDVERDITAGGLDYVPVSVFDGPDYVALGHIHARSRLTDRVRYSGAPLHYSFGEADRPRGAWLVELDEHGLDEHGPDEHDLDLDDGSSSVSWVELPIPRALTVLRGGIDELLEDPALVLHEEDWVSAILTDDLRPLDGMRRLQKRFPWCVKLEHRPPTRSEQPEATYAERVRGRSDHDIVGDFLALVRGGEGPSEYEKGVLLEAIADVAAESAEGGARSEPVGVLVAPRRTPVGKQGRDEAGETAA